MLDDVVWRMDTNLIGSCLDLAEEASGNSKKWWFMILQWAPLKNNGKQHIMLAQSRTMRFEDRLSVAFSLFS